MKTTTIIAALFLTACGGGGYDEPRPEPQTYNTSCNTVNNTTSCTTQPQGGSSTPTPPAPSSFR